ncbi:MAG: hypothetical protein QXP04_03555, partial [Candidatus Nanoarchaeia archaeon]|nr:hypothetical protein [Candidatus Jingweiarchaeum tengchongense]
MNQNKSFSYFKLFVYFLIFLSIFVFSKKTFLSVVSAATNTTKTCSCTVGSCSSGTCSSLSTKTCSGDSSLSCSDICLICGCTSNSDCCQPDCSGKTCGDDGCGGSCGSCNAGKTCSNGQCVCNPNCSCAANTCIGSTCTDTNCGTTCAGTKDCSSCDTNCSGTPPNNCYSCDYCTGQWKNNCSGSQYCDNGTCKDYECFPGDTQNCTLTVNGQTCTGSQECTSSHTWSACSNPCCGVTCPPGYICYMGVCQSYCTGCETAACGECSSTTTGYRCVCSLPIGSGYQFCVGTVDNTCTNPPNNCPSPCPTPDCGHANQAPCCCGCIQGLTRCSTPYGTYICQDICWPNYQCTPSSQQYCTITINETSCSGIQQCKSDGSGWEDCIPTDSNCGYQTCSWKTCDDQGINCSVEHTDTFKANESCPSGCTTNNDCPNKLCQWKECSSDQKCNINKSGIYPKNQDCPLGCTVDSQCTNTHDCTWKECDAATQTCSVLKSGIYPINENCPTGCSNDSGCQTIKYACNVATGTCYQDTNGPYSSLTTCQNNCTKVTYYSCNTSTWSCYENSSGPYSSLTDCQNNCQPTVNKYSCNSNTGTCYQDTNGPYSSLTTCQNNCNISSVSIILNSDKTIVEPNQEVTFTATGNNVSESYGLDWVIDDTTQCKYHSSWTDCGKFKNCQKMSFNNSYLDLSFLDKIPLISNLIKSAQGATLTSTLTYAWSKNGTYNVLVKGKDLKGNIVTSNTVTITVQKIT